MQTLVDFDQRLYEADWVTVNDGVMGGLSTGCARVTDGRLRFTGKLSLQNNGGVASVRREGRGGNPSAFTQGVLRVRGDGRTYQLRLATDARHRGKAVSFGADFATSAGEWIEVRVPLCSLTATVRGSALPDAGLDRSMVREIGLLIADKREDPFALEVAWIAAE